MKHLLALLCLTAPLWAGDWTWNESPRDIYRDGAPDREARFYYSRDYKGGVLMLPELAKPILLKQDEDERVVVYGGNAAAFRSEDDGLKLVTAGAPKTEPLGEALTIDGKHYLFNVWGHQFLMARHEGLLGPVTAVQLHQALPTWLTRQTQYQSQKPFLTALQSLQSPTSIKVYFGSWCGDSRRQVPRLLKVLETVANPNIQLELVAIPGDFSSPQPALRDDRVTNVPTIIVSREGQELGRIVEEPQMGSLEEDLAAMIDFSYLDRIGHLREARLVASGVYEHKNVSGDLTGLETFKVWSRDKGGEAWFSLRTQADGEYQTWLLLNKDGEPSWLEVTRRDRGQISRARYRLGKEKVTGTIRGSDRGLVRQELYRNQPLMTATPSTLINGRLAARIQEPAQKLVLMADSAHLEPVAAPVQLSRVADLALGRFRCVETRFADQTWLTDLTTDLPLRLETPTGVATMIQLEVTPPVATPDM